MVILSGPMASSTRDNSKRISVMETVDSFGRTIASTKVAGTAESSLELATISISMECAERVSGLTVDARDGSMRRRTARRVLTPRHLSDLIHLKSCLTCNHFSKSISITHSEYLLAPFRTNWYSQRSLRISIGPYEETLLCSRYFQIYKHPSINH